MAFLEKAVLLYLTLAIACIFWQPALILGNDDSNANMLSWFGVTIDENDTIGVNGSRDAFNNAQIVQETKTGNETQAGFFKRGLDFTTNFFQIVVDGLANVMGFLALLLRIVFSPFVIFYNFVLLGAPLPVLFIFAIPLVMMFFMGMVYFIRGGQ